METANRKAFTVYAESTPNPATLRYVTNLPLLPDGRMLEFTAPEECENISPLAEKIFNLPFVTGVFLGSNFITVTKNNSVDWDLVQMELREYIQDYLREDGRVLNTDINAVDMKKAEERAVSHAEPATEDDAKIITVLDEYVKPGVEGDGGHIAFRSYKEGVVTVQLQGSCSGCPSSMVTLKGGIENLLKQMVPGVREVVAEEL